MRWLVQEILGNENYLMVIGALEETQTEYLIIRYNKDNTLTVLDNEDRLPVPNSDGVIKDFITGEDCMLYGSKSFVALPLFAGLTPGSFSNENFEYEVIKGYLGETLLNSEFIVGELWDLKPDWGTFFIRPTGNTKLFTGRTLTIPELKRWQDAHKRGISQYSKETLMVAPLKKILGEYRFFVVSGVIVASSSYIVDDVQNIHVSIPDTMYAYVNAIVSRFPISEGYVIDIADTEMGYRVIEYNNLNTSGLYGCNPLSLVQAINNFKN